MPGAAFFDLDRTILRGGTGPHLSQAMLDLGLVPRELPGQKALFTIFDVLGETLPSIALARQATVVARGKDATSFDQAALNAAEVIAELIHPFALALIEQHHAEGRRVVMATTTPKHLIAPLADRLGFDDVIATRYGTREDGRFDGSIRGPFVWSTGKLAAVRHYAERHDIDLAESFAYSDSIYDVPLLEAVGRPAAVNPDPRLTLYAVARRWPIVHFDVSPGVLKVPVVGVELQRLALEALRSTFFPAARFDIAGVENIPRHGPAILAVNHRSYFDLVAMAQVVRQSGRSVRFLGKKELFDVPVLGSLFTAIGGIRVDRGGGGLESYDMAALALEGGEVVGVTPQGTIPRGEAFFDPVLRGKTGAARLAALSGAPVIPVGLWGTEKVWPRSSSMPNLLRLWDPPTVRVRVGEPVELKYRSATADTKRIMAAIAGLLPEEARTRHTPTETELRTTYPGGSLPSHP
ncbi:1-acyl-sn-glycerol-3-phosphate acyltransferase [Knoellia remsis]|uniref:1-acyl-sn-glycerol-3-phosphate acyltransferase n=1 Tax=Knoellia remsis TaxID=407159 RepID=A0A2T0UCH0_9MICO|nr:HAD-IB family hydrolase [Knoellia remsis]PRY55635.1 1-acyl-sn-glycerol-3-phosphate acyltransferase [Knoellia remsis]